MALQYNKYLLIVYQVPGTMLSTVEDEQMRGL